MNEFFIQEYRDEDLPAVATHWKESIRGWPPGFEPGGDWSPESVREWLFRDKYLACWLGWLGDKVVGYLSYSRHWDDKDATYVSFFNVHPDYRSRSFGRKLLVTCVDRAVQDKVKRLDLDTWAANKEAVPLYKKCGFFWRPRTEVYMYNFLPTVLLTPLMRDFLGEAHWYEAMRQPLEIEEDDEFIDGCRYHRYVFETRTISTDTHKLEDSRVGGTRKNHKGGRRAEVLVDPSTSGVVGVILDDLTIRCDIPGETHIAGLRHPATWTFKSGRSEPVAIELKCTGGEGLNYSVEESFKLEGERTLETEVKIAPDIEPEPVDWHGKALDCRVVVNGVESRFRPGLRAVPPFKLETEPYPLRMAPKEILEAVFNLRSRIPEPANFTPEVRCTGEVSLAGLIPDRHAAETVSIPAEDSSGLRVTLKAGDEPGSGTVEIGGTLKVGDAEVRIHPVRAHVGVAPKGQPIEIPDDDPMVTAVSNGQIAIKAKRRGGRSTIMSPDSGGSLLDIFEEEIGEPFSDEFSAHLYEIAVESDPHSATVVYRAESRDFPGLKLERRVRIGTGREISVWVTLRNESEKPFTGAVRYKLTVGWRGDAVVPLRDCLVCGSRESWLLGNVPLPLDPSEFGEPWIAWELPAYPPGKTAITGLVFKGASHFNWGWRYAPLIEQAVKALAPGESVDLPPVRVLPNARGWQEVQEAALGGALSKLPTEPRQFIHAESPLFADDRSATFRFHLWRKTASKGSASIRLPDGREEEVHSEKWNMDAPIDVDTPEFAPNEHGIRMVDYRARWVSVERAGQLPLIVPVSDSKVVVQRDREGDYDFFSVSNGCIEYRVAPEFGGTMYWLSERSDPEKNLLRTRFPEIAMWTWWNPWFGGIQPEFWLGYRFHRSKFVGDVVRTWWGGHDWEGVRVTITPLREWQSLHIESLYLTRPGVPVVLNLLRFAETAGCSRRFVCCFSVFPRPTGDDKAPMETLIPQGGVPYRVSRSEEGAMTGRAPWAASYDPATGKTVGLVIARGSAQVFEASGEGQALELYTAVRTLPDVTVQHEVVYFIADKPELIAPLGESVLNWDRVLSETDPEPQTG